MATSSQTRSESWGSGKGGCVCAQGLYPLHAGCHGSTCSAEPVWVCGRVSSPAPLHTSSLSHPKTSLPQSPSQGQSSLLQDRMRGWARPSVCTTASVHTPVQAGGVSLPPSPHIPMLFPSATPAASTAFAACTGLPELACPPSAAMGSVGSPLAPSSSPCRCPHRPLGLAAGVRLLELLAKHLHLSTASFINIR